MISRIRRLLHLDLSGLTWRDGLAAVASEARDALPSQCVLVALREADAQWTAVTSAGTWLTDATIEPVASLAVLNAVWSRGEMVMESIQPRHPGPNEPGRRKVLCVPLRWWEGGSDLVRRSFGGALYLERHDRDAAFDGNEIEFALDFAALTERLLSLLRSLNQAHAALDLAQAELQRLRVDHGQPFKLSQVSSKDAGFIERVLRPLAQAATAARVSVLLLGPTGSGKSHLARAFHDGSDRKDAPFVVFDCGQPVSDEALAAELFGYGTANGQTGDDVRPGKAQAANGGSLFIDEVAALPPALQTKLLRLVQDGRYTPLGAASEQSTDVQIIAATNASLSEMVESGRFREDLYWRLAELALELPPLDERRADIPALAHEFLANACERARRAQTVTLAADALRKLELVEWRRFGNLRGLQHTLTRAVLRLPAERTQLHAEDMVLDRGIVLPDTLASSELAPEFRRDRDTLALRELLASKIVHYHGNLNRMCSDAELARRIDGASPPLAYTSLRVLVRRLDLLKQVEAARQARLPTIDRIVAALEQHGSVGATAAALDITRDMLVWRLRRAGLSIKQVRRRRSPD